MTVEFLQRGLDVIVKGDRQLRSGRDDAPKPGHWDDRQQHIGDLVSGRARSRAREALHCAQTADEPMATDTATCSNVAVLASRDEA